MTANLFFRAAVQATLADVVTWTGATPADGAVLTLAISNLAPLEEAGPTSLTFLDNPRYAQMLDQTQALACLIAPRFAGKVPPHVTALVCPEPYRAFAMVLGRLYPEAMRPLSLFGTVGVSPSAFVHPEARLEADVTIDPGAVVGPRAEIGSGSVIGANAVIGPSVKIGRNCSVGAQATVVHALIGNRVILYPGARIGQDGFGYAMGARGHLKVPQIGRVVIQDDVEIGANTTIDRGSIRDTVIGEGSKIDNLVQIAHNVVIGRHCIIVSQTGISGSSTLGDFAVTAGQAGLAGHIKIGAGAQIGAQAGVIGDVPAGEKWGGTPAQPLQHWLKQEALLRKMLRDQKRGGDA